MRDQCVYDGFHVMPCFHAPRNKLPQYWRPEAASLLTLTIDVENISRALVWAYSEGVFLRGILTDGSLGTIESASPTASVGFAGLANLSNGQKTDHAWNSGENRSRLKANLHRHATHTHTHTHTHTTV